MNVRISIHVWEHVSLLKEHGRCTYIVLLAGGNPYLLAQALFDASSILEPISSRGTKTS